MFDALKFYKGKDIDLEGAYRALIDFGYKRTEGISEEGDFSQKGESFVIYPATFEYPIRIELFHNKIESIRTIDPVSYKTIADHEMVIILPIKGMLRKRKYSPKALKKKEIDPIDTFVDIEPSDYVVHVDYGIGKYLGIERIKTKDGFEDNLVIEYKDKDKLYVPFDDLGKIQKYVSFHKRPTKLLKMGSSTWLKAKEGARKGAAKVALEVLEIQAKRKALKGFGFSKDTEWQEDLEKSFPYKDTADQIKALLDVKTDMESAKPMDRLLCGDVGYGKTEVALRAAFKSVMDNKQVAILVPTTILAEQHYTVFSKRMKNFPVNIEMLSRFRTKGEQSKILNLLGSGKIDIIIGTHRLLSKDVSFKDLGLLIIDEEQRFGVHHKEKLKRMRLIVDVLTLTATPIPRTLYLALMGGKDISSIETPPLERLPVQTFIKQIDYNVVRQAISREIDRKGQVFFVHNRVDGIEKIGKRLKKMLPDTNIAIAHGRMHERDLEKTMSEFIKGEVDVLVCTTIIESGIDIPNANTIIINNADFFGLADLYQLRGRVGRFNKKASCYLLVNNLKSLAGNIEKRLSTIKKYQELGSGFKIAMQDLQIRGAGNILGVEQHGFIDSVGFDLYCRLLRNAIKAFKGDVSRDN